MLRLKVLLQQSIHEARLAWPSADFVSSFRYTCCGHALILVWRSCICNVSRKHSMLKVVQLLTSLW
eukprot:4557410-Amphidinium_carterae.1